MISLEEVRQTVTAEFKAVHDANYAAIPVNYDNFRVVNIEHQKSPFVDFSIGIDQADQADIGRREIFVIGSMTVIYYYQQGKGGQGAMNYIDMINSELGMRTLNSVHYRAARVMKVSTFPGWVGVMALTKFEVVLRECA